MLIKLRNYFFNFYHKVISSIAFYPTIISIVFFFLSLLTLWLIDAEVNAFLQKNYPFLVINNPDTARSILSTLIGGIISLTVFSFSMVMVLLSQASSNFSPRLLPGLISDTRNQVTLGIFLGTIIFNMMVLISILPVENKDVHSGFSVLVGIILGIVCLGMFVYFIHFMSTEIQINNILDRIFDQTKARIDKQIEMQKNGGGFEDDENDYQHSYKNKVADYYQGVNLEGLLEKIEKEKINLKVRPHKGMYTLPNTDLFIYDKELEDEVLEEIYSYLIFENNYEAANNYILGMRQLSEVGVKAMSPGINDPGTAIISIEYLTELLALRMQLSDTEIHKSKNGTYRLNLTTINFKNLLYQILASYRQYSKHDVIVMQKLINMLKYLREQTAHSEKYLECIDSELDSIRQDIRVNIANKRDLSELLGLLDQDSD